MDARFTPAHRGGSGEPLLLLHGFTDTWRTWELTLPALEARHDVYAPTLPGHAGGPDIEGEPTTDAVLDQIERMMDEAGFETAHIAGNSLGGYLTLHLAARGRARTAVALAPAGGWAVGDTTDRDVLGNFLTMRPLLQQAAPHADALAATPEGRRQATALFCEHSEHLPADLVAHVIRGAAACPAVEPLIAHALEDGWHLDAAAITCPVRMVWGASDQVLRWPGAAARYREDWLPNADWVLLDGVGHCPQLDVPTEAAQLILGTTAG